LVLSAYFWGRDQIQKYFWYLLISTINFCFGSAALSFCFIRAQLGPLLHFFGPFKAIFLPFGAIFGVKIRFKNIFGAYLCRKSFLVFEVQPDLFVFNSAKLGAILNFWGLSELFLGLGSGSKTFLEPTYLDQQILFSMYSSILLFLNFPVLFRMAGRPSAGLDFLTLKPTQPKLKLGLGLSLAIGYTSFFIRKEF